MGESPCGFESRLADTILVMQEVVEHGDEFVQAAQDFRELATELMTRLAHKLGASPEDFSNNPIFWGQYEQTGMLDEDWEYFFHGYGCRFGSESRWQALEVLLGIPGEFGALEPYFFGGFLGCTPKWKHLAALAPDKFSDMPPIMKALCEAGYLKQIETENHGTKYIAAD